MPGRSINLDYSRASADCAGSVRVEVVSTFVFSHLSALTSFSLSPGGGPI